MKPLAERDAAALLDIVGACRAVQAFTKGMEKEEVFTDAKTLSAVQHQIAILGEAVKRLSPEFRAEHGQVAWRRVAGMRDKLVHDYDNVNPEEVWSVVTVRVPDLLAKIEPLLPKEEE